MGNGADHQDVASSPTLGQSSNAYERDPVDRAEELIQLFNRVQQFLSQLVKSEGFTKFNELVKRASICSAAVRANAPALRQFGMLRNAIVHDEGYPPHIVAVPSSESLVRFKQIAHEVLEPTPLIPTFARQVRCFSPTDTISKVLGYLRRHDFSQVIMRSADGKLCMLTVEGITWWLADNLEGDLVPASTVTLDAVIVLEPPDAFLLTSR